MSVLPDPTRDLDWSGYDGSIQWHFGENARKFPDRTCVVETESLECPERVFTYRQIYEASNVLAHYLSESGISNDDVVMIWAHRSVDLVVSIMGTLASGATFSVLDPAYPPARQIIYLEVAQPRALVNLARATDESGKLAPNVRNFIDQKLDLKAEVPALRLSDDGILRGSDPDRGDLFAQVRAKASAPPNVDVGPDSHPTLSFTSGSEGRPKGVLGRHFSLVKYFGWMAKRFNLSSDSRYTLLSGIAHDPVQRDIFTPLYLGAQLLVPSKEDIQHEKLAEWMSKHKPTVTHLTPAMGQILVGGAEAEFLSLDRAFFVGDILTTRDCRSLRRLAINANIVNMYGTTETQRAVSYFEILSRAQDPTALDRLANNVPAGQGMENVQLIIVNPENRSKICKVGEVGEIYVRAAGLAEGYKDDQAMNEQKFLMNWFVDNKIWTEADKKNSRGEPWRKYYKGPRDRLYRTGDLGKYLESGDVECAGRVDDQVKIRGFRIELNEIDSYVGQHILIRDCKTLVRRDKDEEPKLVSYVVPELTQWPNWLKSRGLEEVEDEGIEIGSARYFPKRFRRIQTEMRDHLKNRLPDYAIPTYFIVLQKLPLNPNGKVDKPNLPFPDVAELTEEASEEDLKRWESLTDTERTVATKWADLLPGLNSKTVTRKNDFFDLGGHSILAQQMLLLIQRETGAHLPINKLYEFPRLEGFSAQIDKQLSSVKDDTTATEDRDPEYTQSLDELLETLPAAYQACDPEEIRQLPNPTVFLTGATGFLGAYIIKEILSRTKRLFKLIAHVRGAKTTAAAFTRLRQSLLGYCIWQDSWEERLTCVVGDLAKPKLGLSHDTWKALACDVDIVIHNGATVHWVKRYPEMMAANVHSTIDTMSLCNEGKPKSYTFISSTSVLDTDHYITLSDRNLATGRNALLESACMQGSRRGLSTGYGQTKWVSEQLVHAAGRRGLRGSIFRPGYILNDANTGVCNTDDFLIRMLKGCIQLSSRPRIINTVNAIPVNHAARIVVAAALNPLPPSTLASGQPASSVHVIHGTAHPRLRMNEFLAALEYYGYDIPEVDYDAWKNDLENFVSAGGQEKDHEQHALIPLFHFCVSDLPGNTRAPELDDRNAVCVLKDDARYWSGVDESAGDAVTLEGLGKILAYLVEIGFVKRPEVSGRLPAVPLEKSLIGARNGVGGRGGANK